MQIRMTAMQHSFIEKNIVYLCRLVKTAFTVVSGQRGRCQPWCQVRKAAVNRGVLSQGKSMILRRVKSNLCATQ